MDNWLGFAFWDPLIHTWDLAQAVDQPVIVDAQLCERALERAQAFDAEHNLRRPGVASAETSPPTPDALGRVLSFAGRDPAWKQPP
jgi:hypothetical protein